MSPAKEVQRQIHAKIGLPCPTICDGKYPQRIEGIMQSVRWSLERLGGIKHIFEFPPDNSPVSTEFFLLKLF